MRRILLVIVIGWFVMTVPARAWTEQDISHNGLYGSLIPAGDGKPAPMVLILPGSGPVDRDGNAPGMDTDNLKLLARGLADLGISSLRIDKRGVGESYASGPRIEDLRFGTYVDDAVLWLEFLRGRSDVSKLFIVGHSEGALIGTLAAKKASVTGLILLEGAGTPIADVLARQLASAGVSQKVQRVSKEIAQRLEQGVGVPDVPVELTALYQPRVQEYLMSWMPIDPAAELSTVTCPVLIVQGSTDLQVFLDDAHHLSAALPSARLVVIPGMNHILKEAPEDRAQNFATYGNSFLPLDPQLLPVLADFVRER